jgi:cysteine-rich repeat protein
VEVAVPDAARRELVFVDAHTGKVVHRIDLVRETLSRRVFDSTLEPGSLVWQEGDTYPYVGPRADGVNALIDSAGDVYRFFATLSGGSYDGWDGAGAVWDSVLLDDFDPNCPNAFWDGVATSVCPGTVADDVIAHEWGHAITESSSDLIYEWQPGALNESVSDVWGELVDRLDGTGTDLPEPPRSDGACAVAGGDPFGDESYRWLVAEDSVDLGVIRDMWNPSCFSDPDRVTSAAYHCAESDGGGVHTNSGVPNHLFALLVDGGTFNGSTVSGIGIDRAAAIWWRAQMLYEVPTTDFSDHGDSLEQSCDDLIGETIWVPDPTSGSPTPSAAVIEAGHCSELVVAITAVELRSPPPCAFEPLLDPSAPPLCGGAAPDGTLLEQDFESGFGGWTAGTRDVASPATFDTADWAIVTGLPDDRSGYAAFVADPPLGDCATDDETGVLWLESPAVVLPAGNVILVFDHWVATEPLFDGGNLKISVDGGPWVVVPEAAFHHNAYNDALAPAEYLGFPLNSNPMAGEPAFTGSDGGSVSGSWGQSHVALSGLAAPGASVRFRWEMGLDCGAGRVGWYLDDVRLITCPECGDGGPDSGEECDDGNSADGDGCSAACAVESGFACTPAETGYASVVADGSFEAGRPNPYWTEASTNFGSPLCDIGCGVDAATDGSWYAWFGGAANEFFEGVYEEASLEQTVTVPSGGRGELSFDLWVSLCDTAADHVRVLLGGSEVFHTGPCSEEIVSSRRTVDVVAFADGASHLLRIEGVSNATNGGWANFILDRVELTAPDLPSVCTPSCSDLLTVSSHTVTGVESYAACQVLTAGPDLHVTATGDLELVAGVRVELGNGVSVANGGRLTVTLTPALDGP